MGFNVVDLDPDREGIGQPYREAIRVRTIDGKRLFTCDFNGLKGELARLGMLDELARLIGREPPKSALTLTVLPRRDGMTGAELEKLKSIAKTNKPYVRAGAVVGLKPVSQILYNMVALFTGRRFGTFDTVAAALEWLTQQ